jgi:[methyl-Co(III) methanol-specific corrinoid protein]:coenzyme M methyltransferase
MPSGNRIQSHKRPESRQALMEAQRSDNLVLELIKGRTELAPVCSCPLVTPTLGQMNGSGLYYPNAHSNPQAMAFLASQIYTSIGFQGIRVPFDLCVEAEAFGCKVRKGDRESPPSIAERAFGEKEMLSVNEDIFRRGRFQVVFEALNVLNEKFGHEIPIYGGMAGPLTLVGHLYDASTVMRWPIKDPQRFDENLGMALDFLVEYAIRLLNEGANVLAILDPTASGDLVSRKHFERHLLPVYQKIRKKIQEPIVLHICGSTADFLDLLPHTGFEAFSFEGPRVSVETAREKIGDRMRLVGNIPTYDILLFGTPDKVREASLEALRDGIDMLAPSCGVPIQTPTQNLKAMVRAVEEFKENRRTSAL